MQQKNLIRKAETFLASLSFDAEPQTPSRSGIWELAFSRIDRGTITLTGQEAEDFYDFLEAVQSGHGKEWRRTVSGQTLRRWLEDAVFDAFEARGVSEALRAAAARFASRVTEKGVRWRVYGAVSGVTINRGARRVGDVVLRSPTRSAVQKLRQQGSRYIGLSTSPASAKKRITEILAQGIEDVYTSRTIAEVQIEALDSPSASELAVDKFRDVVDLLNFLAVLDVPIEITDFASVDEMRASRNEPLMIQEGRRAVLPRRAPRRLVNLQALFRPRPRSLARRVLRLASLKAPSQTQLRILAALRRVGRGHSRARPADAFVDYTVALEALLLGREEGDIGYRFRLRCAQVVGRTTRARNRVFDQLAATYGLRSKLVHAGQRNVDETELELVREIAQHAVIELMTGARFRGKGFDLEDWFRREALRRRR